MWLNSQIVEQILCLLLIVLVQTTETLFHQKTVEVDLQAAINSLANSVNKLTLRIEALEVNLSTKFQKLEESQNTEDSTMRVISSRLNVLESVSQRVENLDRKLEHDTNLIRRALLSTNRDVQHLSTRLEGVERTHLPQSSAVRSRSGTSSTFHAANARLESLSEGSDANLEAKQTPEVINQTALAREVSDQLFQRVERALPKMLASELNHFYLNMGTKFDQNLNQMQKATSIRLHRVETTLQEALAEVQEGRQDVSHLQHLQRDIWTNISRSLDHVPGSASQQIPVQNCSQSAELTKEILKSVLEEVGQKSLETPKKNAKKDSVLDLWSSIFPEWNRSSQAEQSTDISSSPALSSAAKRCPDPLTFAALEEVKMLLRSLVDKGEELRKALTRQAGEGVDLLKHLHQRFSVLLRRINTGPNQGEALVAEVQELEDLVQNSYASILHAQNVFITSCHRIQEGEPTIENKIVEVLNKLVTNIELGHQFNKKQIQEMKELVEEMSHNDHSKSFAFFPPGNFSPTQDGGPNWTPSLEDEFTRQIQEFVADVNATEDKFHSAIERIDSTEKELLAVQWKSSKVKNNVDTLLTAAKDIKGFSRSQMSFFESLQDSMADLLEEYIEFKTSLVDQSFQGNQIAFAVTSKDNATAVGSKRVLYLPENCAVSLLNQLKDLEPKSSIGTNAAGPSLPRTKLTKGGLPSDLQNEDNLTPETVPTHSVDYINDDAKNVIKIKEMENDKDENFSFKKSSMISSTSLEITEDHDK